MRGEGAIAGTRGSATDLQTADHRIPNEPGTHVGPVTKGAVGSQQLGRSPGATATPTRGGPNCWPVGPPAGPSIIAMSPCPVASASMTDEPRDRAGRTSREDRPVESRPSGAAAGHSDADPIPADEHVPGRRHRVSSPNDRCKTAERPRSPYGRLTKRKPAESWCEGRGSCSVVRCPLTNGGRRFATSRDTPKPIPYPGLNRRACPRPLREVGPPAAVGTCFEDTHRTAVLQLRRSPPDDRWADPWRYAR